jgi:hypothetical protein
MKEKERGVSNRGMHFAGEYRFENLLRCSSQRGSADSDAVTVTERQRRREKGIVKGIPGGDRPEPPGSIRSKPLARRCYQASAWLQIASRDEEDGPVDNHDTL